MNLKLPLTLAMFSLCSMNIHAQTQETLNLGPLNFLPQINQDGYSCGRTAAYCLNIPFTSTDGIFERVSIDTAFNAHFIQWTQDPLDLQGFTAIGNNGGGFYGAEITSVDNTTSPPTYSFYGTNKNGVEYTGTFSLQFTSYYSRGGGGKGGGGAGTIWVIIGGSINITYIQ